MNTQPNALRLAKWLDAVPSSGYALPNQAAAELRRLHEVNQELLEALREIVEFWDSIVPTECINEMHIKASAAIAKATGEQV